MCGSKARRYSFKVIKRKLHGRIVEGKVSNKQREAIKKIKIKCQPSRPNQRRPIIRRRLKPRLMPIGQ